MSLLQFALSVIYVSVAVVTSDPVEGDEHGAAAKNSEIQQVGVMLPVSLAGIGQ